MGRALSLGCRSANEENEIDPLLVHVAALGAIINPQLRGNGPPAIGELRNQANAKAHDAEILIHWDDDDWSHPNRIAEQVALLGSSGADVVGYNEMLFWRSPLPVPVGETWRYRNHSPRYALGTSLCYWRKTWEAKPFPDLPKNKQSSGEDTIWIQGLKVLAESSIRMPPPGKEPRMIARIHGGNSQSYDIERMIAGGSTEWTRATVWDERVRGIVA